MSFTKHLAVVLSGALSLALPAKAETELEKATKEAAEDAKAKLEAAGATVTVK